MMRVKQMNLKLKNREVTERKQVGDAESMVNEGVTASGHHGFFRGEGGEV
jgi:pyruvate dehydrogenase kinase 2/3/4